MLEAPSPLLPRRATLPALKSALGSVGLSHPPTADAALSALEKWHRDSTSGQQQYEKQLLQSSSNSAEQNSTSNAGVVDDDDSLSTHLPELLPLLSPFLALAGSAATSSSTDRSSSGGKARSKVKVARGKRRQQQGSSGEGGDPGGGLSNSDLAHAEVEALQRRAVAFLGHLGGANRYLILVHASFLSISYRAVLNLVLLCVHQRLSQKFQLNEEHKTIVRVFLCVHL